MNNEITHLYQRYTKAATQTGSEPQPLSEIAANVTDGERGNFTVEESLISVLEAMIFTHETSWKQKMSLAGETQLFMERDSD